MQEAQPQTPNSEPRRAVFITSTTPMRATWWMSAYVVLSTMVLAVVVAATANGPWMMPTVWALAIAPIGGFWVLSQLSRRVMVYEVSDLGLQVRTMPVYRRLSWVRPGLQIFTWADVANYVEDVDLMLGHFGLLTIGLKKAPGTLRIMPANKQEKLRFDYFLHVFREQVFELNLDQTDRAIQVATIDQRTSFFDLPPAKVISVCLLVVTVGMLVLDLLTQWDEKDEWRMFYALLILAPLTFFFVRRSFRKRVED